MSSKYIEKFVESDYESLMGVIAGGLFLSLLLIIFVKAFVEPYSPKYYGDTSMSTPFWLIYLAAVGLLYFGLVLWKMINSHFEKKREIENIRWIKYWFHEDPNSLNHLKNKWFIMHEERIKKKFNDIHMLTGKEALAPNDWLRDYAWLKDFNLSALAKNGKDRLSEKGSGPNLDY